MNGILMKNTKKKRCNKFSTLMQSMNLVLQYKKSYLISLVALNTILAILPYLTLFISQKLLNMIGSKTEKVFQSVVRVRRKSPKSVSRKQPILVKRKSP